MKKNPVRTVVVCAVLMTCSAVQAETDLSISGQVRAQSEAIEKNFKSDYDPHGFNYLRSRLSIEAVVDSNTHVLLQLQDSRNLGEDSESGSFVNRRNIDLHQGYIQLDRLWGDRLGFKAGRFEVNLGNERVFGSDDWNYVGRAWEGCEFRYGTSTLNLSGYYLLRYAASADADDDYEIKGLYFTSEKVRLDLFAFLEHDGEAVYPGSAENRLDRASVGTYFERQMGRVDVRSNIVYQFGEHNVRIGQFASAKNDISAYLLTLQAGYLFADFNNLWLAAGVDYTSGDDDRFDDDERYYNNLYYSPHKFRGYMDYFAESDYRGLMDVIFRMRIDPFPQWSFGCDVHYFRRPVSFPYYIGLDGPYSGHHLGEEIDLTVVTSSIAGVAAQGGLSVFYPSDGFAQLEDPYPGTWLYGMLTADF